MVKTMIKNYGYHIDHYQCLSHIWGIIGHYSAWTVNNMISNMINNIVNKMIKNNSYHIDHYQCLSHIMGLIGH